MADLRIERTKRAVHSAMEQLLIYKEYHTIKIKDLAHAALINRNTFYLHYQGLNDVLAELVGEVLDRQSDRISAEKFSHEPFILFHEMYSNLTPMEHKILDYQQNDLQFKTLLIRLITQRILGAYSQESAVWFAFGKITAIMAWLSFHDEDWTIDKDAQPLQMMYDQEKLN